MLAARQWHVLAILVVSPILTLLCADGGLGAAADKKSKIESSHQDGSANHDDQNQHRAKRAPFDALNGFAVGKRPFDSLSGLAMGKRAPFDALSGLAVGKRAPFDALSGLAVGKRAPFDALSGLAVGKRLLFDSLSGSAVGKRVPFDALSGSAMGKRAPAPLDNLSNFDLFKRWYVYDYGKFMNRSLYPGYGGHQKRYVFDTLSGNSIGKREVGQQEESDLDRRRKKWVPVIGDQKGWDEKKFGAIPFRPDESFEMPGLNNQL